MTLKLSAIMIFSFLLFASCKNSLSGKWYVKTVEDLEKKKTEQRKDCDYFYFHSGGVLTFNGYEGKEDSAEYLQSGDTLKIRGNAKEPFSLFSIAFPGSDSLVLTGLEPKFVQSRISFSSKCTPTE